MEEKKQDDTVENKKAPRASKMSMRLAALGISLAAVCAYAARTVIAQRATDPVLTYVLVDDISNQTYTPPAIGTGGGGVVVGGGGGVVPPPPPPPPPPRPCGSPAVPHVAATPHVSKVSYKAHVSKVSYKASTASKPHVSKVSAKASVSKKSVKNSQPSKPSLPSTDPCPTP